MKKEKEMNKVNELFWAHKNRILLAVLILIVFIPMLFLFIKPKDEKTEVPTTTKEEATKEVKPEFIYPKLGEKISLSDRTITFTNPRRFDSSINPGYQVIVSVDVSITNKSNESIDPGSIFFTDDSKVVMTTLSIGALDSYNEMSSTLFGAKIKSGATVSSKVSIVLGKNDRSSSNTYVGYYNNSTATVANRDVNGYSLNNVIGKVYLIKIFNAYGSGAIATEQDLQTTYSSLTTVNSPYAKVKTGNKLISIILSVKNISAADVSLGQDYKTFTKAPAFSVKYSVGGLEKQAAIDETWGSVVYGKESLLDYTGVLKTGNTISGRVLFEIATNAENVDLYVGSTKVGTLY